MASAFGLRFASKAANTAAASLGGILEAAVHALPVERHDGVRRIADQQRASADMPAVEVERAQGTDGMRRPVGREFGHQRKRIGKFGPEERLGGARSGNAAEARMRPVVGQEQRHCEAAFAIRQGNAHVMAAWPDMQRVALDRERGGRIVAGRNLQLLVTVPQLLHAFAERRMRVHGGAQGRPGTIGSDHHRRIHRGLLAGAVSQAQRSRFQIGTGQPLVEVHRGACRLGGVQHQGIEAAARHRPDHLGVVHAVALEPAMAGGVVHHSPAHHHGLFEHAVRQSGGAQGVQAALREREVDRAPP